MNLKIHVIRNMTGAKQHAWLRKEYLTGSLFIINGGRLSKHDSTHVLFAFDMPSHNMHAKTTACMQ